MGRPKNTVSVGSLQCKRIGYLNLLINEVKEYLKEEETQSKSNRELKADLISVCQLFTKSVEGGFISIRSMNQMILKLSSMTGSKVSRLKVLKLAMFTFELLVAEKTRVENETNAE